MTEQEKDTVIHMVSEGRNTREIYNALPHVPVREIVDTIWPRTGPDLTPEERVLNAIFGKGN